LTTPEREVFDACRAIEKKLVLAYFGPDAPPIKVFRERSDGSTRLWARIPGPNGEIYEHSGQPDVVYRCGTRALIMEYKTLLGDVPDAPTNKQLRDQVVLYRGNNALLDEIATAVIQPLVTHEPVICRYDAEAMKRAEREMFDRVRASNSPDSIPTAGNPQCEHCLAKKNCVAYQQWSGSMLPAMLNVLDVPMSAWTPEQRAFAAANIGPAQKFLDNLSEFLKEGLAKDPTFCPGWTLKPGARKETITDPQRVFDRFAGLGGKLEDFMACIAVGKMKLKDRLAQITGARGKKLDEALSTVTEGCIEVSQNRPSLAKAELTE
ncbi:MAG TPA: hypothetical protein VIY48_04745, partial [Candidatus Paceibacterota bacterium]